MSINSKLGKLEKIDDLRSIWDTEARDFTPWLAKEENLTLLGDTIGMDLELEATEKDVGPFRADILCKETTSPEHWVLIENQIERTDHVHLGQILTYAAGLNAVTIVWIAKQFSDEHRASLDWLNEMTVEEVKFFGLEIELWRIGESPIAPKFNIVSKPNEWTKGGGGTAKSGTDLTETQKLQLEYWTAFGEYMQKNAKTMRSAKPHPANWLNFSMGRAYFGASAVLDTRGKRIAIRMYIEGPHSDAHYQLLLVDKEQIEAEFGEALSWEELPHRKSSYVSLYKENEDPTDKACWSRQHEWLLIRLEKFREIFSERIKALDAGDWTPDIAEN